MQRGNIVIAEVKAGSGHLTIDYAKAFKVISAIVSLSLGPKGIPSFLSNIGEVNKVLKKELGARQKVQAQGFAIFTAAIVEATIKLIREHADYILVHEDSMKSLTTVILESLDREPINVSRRFLATPALNPAFVRVRESILSLLERPALHIAEGKPQIVATNLGKEFVQALDHILQSPETSNKFTDFVGYLNDNAFTKAANRASIWDAYSADLNRQLYRRLFLHELDDRPEITLPDVFIPSRAVYREECEGAKDAPRSVMLNCVDLKEELNSNWLYKPLSKVGHSRLVTGDPGTGKSTFSLIYAKALSDEGYRVLFIPANSIRSLNLSFESIVETHVHRTLRLEGPPSIDQIIHDQDLTGKPILIVLDGLDEYDVGGTTVSVAAGRLVDHVMTVMDEWCQHGHDVRLLLCGRPEATSSLTRFREKGRHLHVTGFVYEMAEDEIPADMASEVLVSIDQREQWWQRWQLLHGKDANGLPVAISEGGREVAEITAQPLLNYMLAVLQLYNKESLTNLSSLYGSLFSRYFVRQFGNNSGTFARLCPSLDRFQRVMSEIGIAAWHAGDRSVSVADLQRRFDKPPLKGWFDQAGSGNSGLGAILSAFYTRPEDAASPDSGLAQRYVFTHKSFREYLTAVGIVRFLQRLSEQLSPDAENGWSDAHALKEWLNLFGHTSIDHRQWQFLITEIQLQYQTDIVGISKVKEAVERIFDLSLKRKMPCLSEFETIGDALKKVGNAEEAVICILSAIRNANILDPMDRSVVVQWPSTDEKNPLSEHDVTLLRELVFRMRARPGSPDEMISSHIKCLFEIGSYELNRQVGTVFRTRPDSWTYANTFDFTGIDLEGSNFSNARLAHTRFHRATLEGANFSDSDLTTTDFCFASTSSPGYSERKVNFSNADLSQSRFMNSSIEANWSEARLLDVDLRGASVEVTDADTRHSIMGDLHFMSEEDGKSVVRKRSYPRRKKASPKRTE